MTRRAGEPTAGSRSGAGRALPGRRAGHRRRGRRLRRRTSRPSRAAGVPTTGRRRRGERPRAACPGVLPSQVPTGPWSVASVLVASIVWSPSSPRKNAIPTASKAQPVAVCALSCSSSVSVSPRSVQAAKPRNAMQATIEIWTGTRDLVLDPRQTERLIPLRQRALGQEDLREVGDDTSPTAPGGVSRSQPRRECHQTSRPSTAV